LIDPTIIAEHDIGEKAKEFVVSDLGRFIDGRSKQDFEEAKLSLLKLDPFKFDTLQSLQNEIASIQHTAKVAEGLILYIAEAIQRGEQALHKLSEEDENG
jgi:hypothetical protein